MTQEHKLDPFDLESLALSQNFADTAGVRKLLKTVPVRRPNPQDFVRTHPLSEFQRDFLMVELRDDREQFLVRPEMAAELSGETVMKTLFTAITRLGVVFLWPVTIPPADGKTNEWWASAREAAELASTQWLRVKANMALGAYEMFAAESLMEEPEWPDVSFQELIKIAFRDRLPNLTDASQNLYELIKARSLAVYPDEAMRTALARCVAVESTRGWRISKDKQSHRIDVVVALAQAALAAIRAQRESTYDTSFDWVDGPTGPAEDGKARWERMRLQAYINSGGLVKLW